MAIGLLSLSPGAHAQVEITPPASGVTASTNDGNLPGNAVDNNLTTRWSGNGDGAWMQLDLGTVRAVGSVRLAFFNGNLRRSLFDLQVATTPGAWSNVLTNVESAGTTTADETFDFADVDARWVRYVGHGNSDPAKATWNSVSEISVFEGATVPTPTPTSTPTPTPTPTETPTPPPTATPTPDAAVKLAVSAVTASTNDGNLPANTIDGSLATRWSSNGDGAWIQYDLGAAQTVAHLRVAVYNGNGRQNRFDLQVGASSTGPWSNVLTNALTSGTTTLLETHDFADVSARFVRYVGHMSNVGTFNSLTEVEVWGTTCTDCPTPTPTATATPSPTPTPTVPGGECTRTVNVSSSAQLSAAASGAQPGDCIIAANGSYSAFTVTANATVSSPILIRAANRLGATISSGILRINNGSHVTVEGFRVTSPGGNTTLDGVSRNVIVSIADSDDCRITRFDFKPTAHANGTSYVMLNGNSNRNRVDHSDFGPNTKDGVHYVWPTGNPNIAGVTKPTDRTPWAEGNGPYNPNMARHTQIDHNYFHDMASGTAECVVVGGVGMTGDYQDLHTLVEWNLFTACDGDPEIISIKGSSTIARYNTIRTSSGGIVNRAGNKSQIHGNFFIQGRKSGSIGIRLHEMDHEVYDNYIDGALGNSIIVASGDRYDGTFAHAQVRRAQISHNTAVNSGAATFGSWGGNELAPVDCVFANNILSGSDTLLGTAKPGNTIFSNNIFNGNLGQSRPQSQFWGVNPQFTTVNGLQKLSAGSPAIGYANTAYYPYVLDDMDGHPRSDPDAGADEYTTAAITRRALTTADVGPNAQ